MWGSEDAASLPPGPEASPGCHPLCPGPSPSFDPRPRPELDAGPRGAVAHRRRHGAVCLTAQDGGFYMHGRDCP